MLSREVTAFIAHRHDPPSLFRSRHVSPSPESLILRSCLYTCATVMLILLTIFCVYFCPAETERQGTDHLDLAGLPQRSTNSDSTNTLSTTPESKKKNKGIKKLFGK